MGRTRGWRYWRNLAVFTLCVLVVFGAAGAVYLARWRALALVHPVRRLAVQTPDDYGIADWQDVRLKAGDGLELGGWFIPPPPGADGATLIYLHGLANNRSELLGQAAMLYDHGYGALLLDLRSHGESEGDLTTLGYAEVEDLRGAVAYLLSRPEVDGACIGVVARSMGGAAAIRGAARIPEVQALVVQSTYSSVADNISTGGQAFTGLPAFPFAPLVIWFGEREAGADIGQVRPVEDVGRIAPRAILLIHGSLDPAIPPENSVRLYEAAGEPKELYLVPGAGHGGFLSVDRDGFERRVTGFLDTYLCR